MYAEPSVNAAGINQHSAGRSAPPPPPMYEVHVVSRPGQNDGLPGQPYNSPQISYQQQPQPLCGPPGTFARDYRGRALILGQSPTITVEAPPTHLQFHPSHHHQNQNQFYTSQSPHSPSRAPLSPSGGHHVSISSPIHNPPPLVHRIVSPPGVSMRESTSGFAGTRVIIEQADGFLSNALSQVNGGGGLGAQNQVLTTSIVRADEDLPAFLPDPYNVNHSHPVHHLHHQQQQYHPHQQQQYHPQQTPNYISGQNNGLSYSAPAFVSNASPQPNSNSNSNIINYSSQTTQNNQQFASNIVSNARNSHNNIPNQQLGTTPRLSSNIPY